MVPAYRFTINKRSNADLLRIVVSVPDERIVDEVADVFDVRVVYAAIITVADAQQVFHVQNESADGGHDRHQTGHGHGAHSDQGTQRGHQGGQLGGLEQIIPTQGL